jgi:hypothetical protein
MGDLLSSTYEENHAFWCSSALCTEYGCLSFQLRHDPRHTSQRRRLHASVATGMDDGLSSPIWSPGRVALACSPWILDYRPNTWFRTLDKDQVGRKRPAKPPMTQSPCAILHRPCTSALSRRNSHTVRYDLGQDAWIIILSARVHTR